MIFVDPIDGFTTANFSINSDASNGTAAIDATGNWTYIPTENYNGSDAFTVQVTDDNGNVETQIISITVTQIDDAGSFAGNTSATTNEDTTTAGSVTFVDPIDGFTTANFSINSVASNGTAAIDATGNWTYTPTANYNGSDTFTVQVTDDDGNLETQVVSITVTAVNDAPNFDAVNSLDGNPRFVVDGAAVVLDVDVQIFDQELSGLDDFDGSSLTLIQNGGADAADIFSATGSLSALTESANLVVGVTTIGTVANNSGGTLILTFNNQATNPLINSVLQQIAYSRANISVTENVQIDWVFDDGGNSVQTQGGAALQATGSTKVNITVQNTAPVLATIEAGDLAYNENNSTVTISNTLVLSDIDDAELVSAVIQINNHYVEGEDLLGFTNQNGINGSFDSINGTITLTGTATVAEYQIAIRSITYSNSSESPSMNTRTVSFTVNDGALDSNTQTRNITVANTNDTPLIAGVDTGVVTEDVAVVANNLSANGLLTITNTESGESSFRGETVNGTYGELTIDSNGNWRYNTDNTQIAIQQLGLGQSITDIITVTAFNGTDEFNHNIVLTINGTDDTSIFGSTAITDATQDSLYSYTIFTRNVDINNVNIVSIAASTLPAWLTLVDNGDGTATLSGTPSSAQVGEHNVVLNVSDDDGNISSTEDFIIVVANTNDAALIAGLDTGVVTEDVAVVANNLSANGLLTITNTESGESSFRGETVNGTYGELTIDSNGNWRYNTDNTQIAIQQLGLGQSITDIITVNAFDGTSHNIVLTINGTDDAAVIGGTISGSVTENNILTSSGILTITDTDFSDNPIKFDDVLSTYGSTGYGKFVLINNIWTYSLDNSNAAVMTLLSDQFLTDSIIFMASDGTTRVVVVTIYGSDPIVDVEMIVIPTESVQEETTEEEPVKEEPIDDETSEVDKENTVVSNGSASSEEQPSIYNETFIEDVGIQEMQPNSGLTNNKSAPIYSSFTHPNDENLKKIDRKIFDVQMADDFTLNQDQLDLWVDVETEVDEHSRNNLWEQFNRTQLRMNGEDPDNIEVNIIVGSATIFGFGLMARLLSGGSLLASLVSAVPMLNRFDPLPILKSKSKLKHHQRDISVSNEDGSTPLVDNLFSSRYSKDK